MTRNWTEFKQGFLDALNGALVLDGADPDYVLGANAFYHPYRTVSAQ